MNISLNEHFEAYIQKKLNSGQYHSVSEVVREALRLMQEKDQAKQARLDYYKGEIKKGIESGASTDWDAEEFLAEAKKRAGLQV